MTLAAAALSAAFVTGLASSLGPCVAPRYLIVSAALAGGARAVEIAAFFLGTLGGFGCYAFAGSLLAMVQIGSHAIYGGIAIGLIAAGLAMLWQTSHADARCRRYGRLSLGGMFLLGVSSAFTLSPCCTPIAIAIGLQAASGSLLLALSSLLAFAAGHVGPLVAAWLAARRLRAMVWSDWAQTSSVIAGTLLLALGSVYAVLA
ncbi:MAG: hypothetical protein JOY59_12390 [Candidatus Eremiobacteraeota bacterium]|nr:hypothetical protein [Candidatus Eremiobacteraeota bacterium]